MVAFQKIILNLVANQREKCKRVFESVSVFIFYFLHPALIIVYE